MPSTPTRGHCFPPAAFLEGEGDWTSRGKKLRQSSLTREKGGHAQSSFGGQHICWGWTFFPRNQHKDLHCTPTHLYTHTALLWATKTPPTPAASLLHPLTVSPPHLIPVDKPTTFFTVIGRRGKHQAAQAGPPLPGTDGPRRSAPKQTHSHDTQF